MIYFSNVSKSYQEGNDVLAQVNFHLAQGEMAFLTGPSGSGKTTLLQMLLAFQLPTQGQIIFNGKSIAQLDQQEILALRRSCGAIWQEPRLLPRRTVFDNVALPLFLAASPNQADKNAIYNVLDKVGMLKQAKSYPEQLSSAEQRRVSLARAIVHQPHLVLADEPTAHFDPKQAAEIMQLLIELNQAGTTVLVATHNLTLIAAMPYRILTLKQGKLINGGY